MAIQVEVVTATEHLAALEYDSGMAEFLFFGSAISLLDLRETINGLLAEDTSEALGEEARYFLSCAEALWKKHNWPETRAAVINAEF